MLISDGCQLVTNWLLWNFLDHYISSCMSKIFVEYFTLIIWGLHLTKGQPDPKVDQMSSWPDVVPLLATRCLYLCLSSGQLDPTQYHSWPLDASTGGYIWAQVTRTQVSTSPWSLDALLGGISEIRSTGPKLVPLLATRCLYWGPSDLSAIRTSENLNTLGVLGLASQRFFLWKTNEFVISVSIDSSTELKGLQFCIDL